MIKYFNGPVTLYCQKLGEPDVLATRTLAPKTTAALPAPVEQVATAPPTQPPPVAAPLDPLPQSGYETSP